MGFVVAAGGEQARRVVDHGGGGPAREADALVFDDGHVVAALDEGGGVTLLEQGRAHAGEAGAEQDGLAVRALFVAEALGFGAVRAGPECVPADEHGAVPSRFL